MTEKSIIFYDRDAESAFLTREFNGRGLRALGRWEKRKYYIVKALTQFQETGVISFVHCELIKRVFYGELGISMNEFANSKNKEQEFHKGYIPRLKKHLFDFLQFCKENKIEHPAELTVYLVCKYFEGGKVGDREASLPNLKKYFGYLFQQGILKSNYSSRFPKQKIIRRPKFHSMYGEEEVKKIILSIDRSSAGGKRDYAMTLLAASLGMRISDIANLKFKNINWNAEEINFIQKKTNIPNSLPLSTDIGNALIDYIQNARPKSSEPSVFIRTKPPHVAFANGLSLGSHFKQIFNRSGVPINGRKIGPHSLRHAFSQSMMNVGVEMNVTSAILGHVSLESTYVYLQPDLTGMKQCILPVMPGNKNFYNQSKGKFYE